MEFEDEAENLRLTRLLRNRARCRKCDDIIESLHRHDFRSCKCGAISVDGGLEYRRRVGALGDWEDLSETMEITEDERDLSLSVILARRFTRIYEGY
ncbi:DUF7695 domain-containing protein [Streptomyces anulatus]|uniref:DUF7695 domain-containing protein n=1 Tax=Streptomyces anulatus TaxID=1892 RepID=UPI003F4E1575